MRRFKKNSAVRIVIVPPHGRVHEGDILEGDAYAPYAPMYLTEILAEPSAVVIEAAPQQEADLGVGASGQVLVATDEGRQWQEPLVPQDTADSAAPLETATLADDPIAPKKNKGGRPKKHP